VELPLNQIACKVAPALAAGCTMILKPSEFTPSSALIFAEILHEAGVPKGIFNLINGLDPDVGTAMSEHPDINVISFTGSTRAGIDVAKRAADDRQARLPGIGQQVAERHPRRRRPCRHQRRDVQ
jgi:aldehyde dehydrogenase (NAD+)